MNKQNLYRIIESPHVTEKTSALSINNNQVVFRVNKSATKNQIKKAVEELFSVSVTSVSTSISKGKTKKIGLVYTEDQTSRKHLFLLSKVMKLNLRAYHNECYKSKTN